MYKLFWMIDKNKCPLCHGSGIIDQPLEKRRETKRLKVLRTPEMAKILRRKGHSIREIMKMMEYKSTVSVQLLLNKRAK